MKRRMQRAGGRGVAAGILAALALLTSACQAPLPAASGLYAAWKKQDKTGAASYATAAAVNALFTRTYRSTDEWAFSQCLAADASTGTNPSCIYINRVETSIWMEVDHGGSKKVLTASTYPLKSGVAGRLFALWRKGNKAGAAAYGTSVAVNRLFANTYRESDLWLPLAAEGGETSTSVTCVWISSSNSTITLRVDKALQKVTAVYVDQ